jgi:integrase
MALKVLRLVLSHARGQGIVGENAVEQWKAGRPRRRSSSTPAVTPDKVLAANDLERVLEIAEVSYPRHFPFVLFLADTGARFGEAAALRWSDVDLAAGTARIARSFSSGVKLGPTKTGRTRAVELSQRLCVALAQVQPNIFPIPEESLVFPSESETFLQGTNFRSRVFSKIIVKALGKGRHYTPHCLRHTWASLHLARGTPIKWIQQQGGWTTAKVLLDTYGHYMPDEMRGFADALAATPNGPPAAPTRNSDSAASSSQPNSPDFSWVSEAVEETIIPRSPNRSIGTQRPNPENGAAWPTLNPC